ncbi:hypothetical protein Tsubulata_028858 [Turnera subulata]|uniref:Rapid alkalinization factor 1 n=1 Tax=Turnera subulata TaxID=218843 RepID=A0A9Q0G310_9ROSI|nr:hypothetical protein Tsubulata_028858 [Turnera subulata]
MCATILILMATPATVEGSSGVEGHLGWVSVLPTTTTVSSSRSSPCKGSVAECMAEQGEEEEFGMESEISRRILATTKYISYGALQRNNVPCSRRGASYYNCRPGGQANPYSRGCNAITRCRG